MRKSAAPPSTIRRIAARRVFKGPRGKPVVVTLGVPRAVPGWDWGCALQITGLNTLWRRPRYVFGIDGLQALHLAMKCAGVVLETSHVTLEWLGQSDDLGMPKFLPALPKPQQDRLEAMVEREAFKYWRRVARACGEEGDTQRAARMMPRPECCTLEVRLSPYGPVAQLGARLNGIQEVTGSIPVRSTILRSPFGRATDGRPPP